MAKVKCNFPMETYSRVVGYYRPVQNWNKGKKEEYRQRKTFRPETDDAVVEENGDKNNE